MRFSKSTTSKDLSIKLPPPRQIRTYRDSAGLIDFLQKYILWAIFLTIIAMGFIRNYSTGKKFVVEHWVFYCISMPVVCFFVLLNVVIILIPNMEWTLYGSFVPSIILYTMCMCIMAIQR